MSMDTPEHREVWQEADGSLLMCYNPGVWLRFGSPTPVMPEDPSIVYPLRRVFSKYGVPTMDEPIKMALLEDLEQCQKDRDRWRTRATWLSTHATPISISNSAAQDSGQPGESDFRPPPTTAGDL